MFQKIYKEFIVLILVFGAIWGTSSYFSPDEIETIDISLSVETENKLGKIMIQNIKSSYSIVEDSVVVSAIDEISNTLLTNLDSTEYTYTFYVLDSPEFNAFATFGGNIFIYSGLIELTDSPEELAAVLAHEIGHIEEKHVSKMLIKRFGISIVASILTGGDSALLTEILEYTVNSAFSRSNEAEADDFGLKLLEKSTINPTYMASAFGKLQQASDDSILSDLEFISSHPDTEKRILTALNFNSEKQFPEKTFTEINWEEVKEVLR